MLCAFEYVKPICPVRFRIAFIVLQILFSTLVLVFSAASALTAPLR